MKRINDDKIAEVKVNASKPTIFNGNFPLNDLSDREFEVLCYSIFKERIKYNDPELSNKFDKIDLMSGVGEKGFDSTLYNKRQVKGLIQCKKYKTRLNKPQLIKEILKVVLFSIVTPELIPNKNNFTYYIIASSGYTDTITKLLADFNKNIFKEEIKNFCEKIIEANKTLKDIKIDEKINEIKSILKNILVVSVSPEDILLYLNEYNNIAKTFFKIYTATDNTLIENVVSTYLEPLLKNLDKEVIKISDYKFRFKKYLAEVLNRYSSAQTLVFGNQQKKIEDFYYPLTLTCKDDKTEECKIKINTHKYSDDFIPKYKKVLICDHGGMGKSTILKWLFRSATIENKGIPIFIELRSLNSQHTIIDEITTQLEPIDEELEKEITRNLISKGGFIFFLDGYDEIAQKNKASVTRDISNFVSKAGNNLFILSSRPEDVLKTFGDFQEFSIDKLSTTEAYELIKKIGNNNTKSLQLITQLKLDKREELLEFLESPLLISLLYKKFEYRETIPLQRQEFYMEVYEALFQAHDIIKGDRYVREKKSNLTLYDFHKILRGLAYFTVLLNQIEYTQKELEQFVKKANVFFPGINFDVNNFIFDIITNVPIFQKEGLKYKWSHKTLQEYFAADFICRDTKDKQNQILARLFTAENSVTYNGVIDICYEIDYKSFRKAILYPVCQKYVEYYKNSIECHKTKKNFKDIIYVANQLFDDKISLLKIEKDTIPKLIDNLDDIRIKLESYLEVKIKTLEIELIKSTSEYAILRYNYNKGFPLKRLLKTKNSDLIKNNDKKTVKEEPINIDYYTKLGDFYFLFIPSKLDDFLLKHPDDFQIFQNIFNIDIYNIEACKKLIREVNKENKKEKEVSFFFEGLD